MPARWRRARLEDVHELAICMPRVRAGHGPRGNPIYQVGGKSFVFFRNPRPDAADPRTGERYRDVIVFWVTSESDKQALVQDEASPFFTTPHFDGHPSVLVRGSRIGELNAPWCVPEKLAWVQHHLGGSWLRRTVITSDKTLVGDRLQPCVLVDDRPEIKGVASPPPWTHVLFDAPYNQGQPGPRLSAWADWREVLEPVLAGQQRPDTAVPD
jgi:hypothetical protein